MNTIIRTIAAISVASVLALSTRRAQRRFLAAAAFLVSAACTDRDDPTGTHTGGPLQVHYDPSPKGYKSEPRVDRIVVTNEGEDVYRVTFGPCWAKVKRAKHDIDWKIVEGSDCPTAQGPGKITSGKAVVVRGTLDLYAEGTLSDGKTNVTWTFFSLERSR
jgi:hypothetical protein